MRSIGRPRNLSSYKRKIETSKVSGLNFAHFNKTPTPALKKTLLAKHIDSLDTDALERASSFGKDWQMKFDTPQTQAMKNIYEQ